jgi:HEAT repeat protein
MVENYTVSVISTMEQNRNITGLLYALNNKKDPDIRNRAIDALGRLRSAEAADALLEILKKDKDETAQERAIFALGILKEKRAWNPILEILKNSKEPENVRWASAEAISYYEDLRAVEPLLDALEYARGKVLIGVILSLGRLKDRRAIGPLIKLFEKELTKTFNYNEDWLVLINTAIALQNFEDPRTIKPLSKALKFDRSSFPNCGGRCGDLQREALNALGKIYDKRAFDVIVNTLESGGYALKLNSVNVLKSIENRKVLAPLYRALQTNRNNKTLVEALQNAISEVERYAGETCYFCGEDCEIREIRMIDKPTDRRICQDCWNDIKHEQGNPDMRMVIEVGWGDEDRNAGALKERQK